MADNVPTADAKETGCGDAKPTADVAPKAGDIASTSGGDPKQSDVPGEEDSVTMVDVLEDETALEEDAKAVLGGADEKNCTYLTGGYMKRQPLYSCLSCIPKDQQKSDDKIDYSIAGGVCLACSYQCHEGHDLVELYTKRNFKCDCGNGKFPKELECKLEKNKKKFNEDNKYNQNFAGLYCICHRPYPDPEYSISDEMIQCIICEDWFHGRHLGMDKSQLPKDSSYSEMICRDCISNFKPLHAYKDFAMNLNTKSLDNSDLKVDVLSNAQSSEEKEKECPVKKLNASNESLNTSSFFLTDGWRNHLCKCPDCDKLFKELKIDFLLDSEDTVHHYEAKSKAEVSQYEEGMKALSEMDRVKQVEAIQSYNSMKGNLMEYLKKFATNGKVVKEEDIQEFFQNMKANKRQKLEIPKFCR